jgi:hypothetical protein
MKYSFGLKYRYVYDHRTFYLFTLFLSLVILPHVVVVAVGSGNRQFIQPFGVAGDSRTDDMFVTDTFNVGQQLLVVICTASMLH